MGVWGVPYFFLSIKFLFVTENFGIFVENCILFLINQSNSQHLVLIVPERFTKFQLNQVTLQKPCHSSLVETHVLVVFWLYPAYFLNFTEL